MTPIYIIMKKTNGFYESLGPTALPLSTYEQAEQAADDLAQKHPQIVYDIFCLASRHAMQTRLYKEVVTMKREKDE